MKEFWGYWLPLMNFTISLVMAQTIKNPWWITAYLIISILWVIRVFWYMIRAIYVDDQIK
jgi:hypothetical protein